MSRDADWPWSVLGLDGPPDDARAVKRAYAAKLKRIDPAEDSQAFQALRQAYEAGLRRVPGNGAGRSPRQRMADIAGGLSPDPGGGIVVEMRDGGPFDGPPAIIGSDPENKAPAPDEPGPEAATGEASAEPGPPDSIPDPVPPPPNADRPPAVKAAPRPVPRPAAEPFSAPPPAAGDAPEQVQAPWTRGTANARLDDLLGRSATGEEWTAFLESPPLQDREIARELEGRLFDALLERSGYGREGVETPVRPHGISIGSVAAIDARFGWFSDAIRFQRRFVGGRGTWLLEALDLVRRGSPRPRNPYTETRTYRPMPLLLRWPVLLAIFIVLGIVQSDVLP